MSTFTSDNRYITKGVQEHIPTLLMLFMWEAIDRGREERTLDYLQIFTFYVEDNQQKIKHEQEQPPYERVYVCGKAEGMVTITEKVYVIDDGDHITMLLANEY